MRVSLFAIESITSDPHQPRKTFDEASIESLALSIKDVGLIQPIVLRKDPEAANRFILVTGERRWRAVKNLGREKIEGILTDGNPRRIALIENAQRRDLHPVELARALVALQKSDNLSQGQLAPIVGVDRSTLNQILKITTISADILDEAMLDPIVTRSQLIEIAQGQGSEQQRDLWEQVKAGHTVTVLKATRTGKKIASTAAEKAIAALDVAHEKLTKVEGKLDVSTYQKLNIIRTKIGKVLKEKKPDRLADRNK